MKVETRTFIRILLIMNNIALVGTIAVSLDFFFNLDPASMSELQYGAASAAITGIITGYAAIFRFMFQEYMENVVKLSGVQQNSEFELEGTLTAKS